MSEPLISKEIYCTITGIDPDSYHYQDKIGIVGCTGYLTIESVDDEGRVSGSFSCAKGHALLIDDSVYYSSYLSMITYEQEKEPAGA